MAFLLLLSSRTSGDEQRAEDARQYFLPPSIFGLSLALDLSCCLPHRYNRSVYGFVPAMQPFHTPQLFATRQRYRFERWSSPPVATASYRGLITSYDPNSGVLKSCILLRSRPLFYVRLTNHCWEASDSTDSHCNFFIIVQSRYSRLG